MYHARTHACIDDQERGEKEKSRGNEMASSSWSLTA